MLVRVLQRHLSVKDNSRIKSFIRSNVFYIVKENGLARNARFRFHDSRFLLFLSLLVHWRGSRVGVLYNIIRKISSIMQPFPCTMQWIEQLRCSNFHSVRENDIHFAIYMKRLNTFFKNFLLFQENNLWTVQLGVNSWFETFNFSRWFFLVSILSDKWIAKFIVFEIC